MIAPADLAALLESLRARDCYSLPFEITVRGAKEISPELAAVVEDAINGANHAAVDRVVDDPTWCTPADPIGGKLVAEIAKGTMADDEVTAWLSDLDTRLENSGVRTRFRALKARTRVPNLNDWNAGAPAPTAFLFFTDPTVRTEPQIERRIDLDVVRNTAPALAAWVHVPGAAAIVRKGSTERFVSPGRVVATMLEGMPLEYPQWGLQQSLEDPRRLRLAYFNYDAQGTLQVHNPRPIVNHLDELLAGIRIFGPHLDYAFVRRSRLAGPDHHDIEWNLHRPETPNETLLKAGFLEHLLPDYAVDAYVAQVLTDSHLAKATNLDLFTIEPLGSASSDRHLVVARDPEPWLADLNPHPDVLAKARLGFGDTILTDEIYTANQPPFFNK